MLFVNDIKSTIQKEPTLNFKNPEQKLSYKNFENVLYFKKVVKPTNEEIEKHNKYLKKELKKNFFN